MHSVLDPPPIDAAGTERRPVESRDPATGELWRRVSSASHTDVADAVARARAARAAWTSLSTRRRADHLRGFRRVLFRRRWEMAELIERENGKPAAEAMVAEVLSVLDMARYYARVAPRLLRPRALRPGDPAVMRKKVRIHREPFGVVGIIAPWNYPLLLSAGIALPALVAGNAVILKPSEYTPSSGLLLGEMLREAGVPADVVQLLPGDGAVGAALIDCGVDKLFFTGSTATGQRVALACGARMIPCVLELGGSDAAIVLDDAHLDRAVRGIVWGRFSNAGQTCVAPKRLLVSAAVYDELMARLTSEVEALRLAPPAGGACDVGPLIRPWQGEQLRAQLADATAGGAWVVASTPRAETLHEGFFPPTILAGVTPDMRVMREETFGPLLPVMKVSSDDEAIGVANGSSFGLSASVWTRDAVRARRIAARLEVGSVVINDVGVNAAISEAPHGGVKGSGTGRSHGEEGLLECVRSKTVISDTLGWGEPWWFSYSPEQRRDLDAFARFAHGRGLRERLSGVSRSLRMFFRARRS
jgi:succinate-semialdehyde dehydrogenase/glutarate-semialdehyde dehydrogenase